MTDEARPLPALIESDESVGDESVVLLNPQTGELLELLKAGDGQLGDYLDAVRDWEAMARVAKGVVSAELHRRMDAGAKWTLSAGDFEIVGQSPDRVEYDVGELRAVLRELLEKELISRDAALAAVKREVVFSVSKRGVNALRKIGGEVAKAIDAIGHEPATARRITIKRPK
jgi:hypothetical protein